MINSGSLPLDQLGALPQKGSRQRLSEATSCTYRSLLEQTSALCSALLIESLIFFPVVK